MSFGSAGFGGFGTSNNQTSNAFGGGFGNNNTNNNSGTGFGGFGAANNTAGTPAFGSNNAGATGGSTFGPGFGQNNNTGTNLFNRPAAGGFGSSTPNTGGGVFGQNNTNNNTASTGFGTSGGGFGSTNNASTGFGASTNTGSGIFGANNNNASTNTGFGNTGTALFGATNNNPTTNTPTPSTGFGGGGFGASTNTGFGAANAQANNGTPSGQFTPHVEKDGASNNAYQTITCLPNFTNFSLEELRLQDYQTGKKFGNQNGQAGAFGQASGFGTGFGASNNTNTTSTGFGNTATNTFGANNNNSGTSSGFGQTSTTGGFGSNTATSGGLFGASKPAGSGLFGNTNTTAQQSGAGLFGNNSNNASSGFGANNNSGGLFANSQTQNKSVFGNSTGTGFGNTSTATPAGGGLFGNNNANSNQQQQSTTTNAFGQNQNQQQGSNLFSGGAFGSNNQQQSNNNQGGGLFTGGGFGTQNQQQSGSTGLFGTKPAATTGTGLFGNQTQNQPSTGGGLFGNNNQQNSAGTGLFGAPKPATSTGGLFGNNNTQQQSTGLFGNSQTNTQGTGLFGNTQNQAKPGLFGNSATNNTGGGLFGGLSNNQNQSGTNLFNNSTNQQQNGGSVFGASIVNNTQQNQQAQQNGMTTSVFSTTPYGNAELFASLNTPSQSVGPLATPLSSSQKQRRPAPLPQWKINPAASSRLLTTPQGSRSTYQLRYSQYGTPSSAYGSPASGLLSGTPSTRLGKSLSTSNLRNNGFGSESVLNPDAFSPSRSFRGGSIKKLHINRSLRSDLFGEPENIRSSPLKKNVSFDNEQNRIAEASGTGIENQALTRVDDEQPSASELGFLRSSARAKASANGVSSNGAKPTADNEVAEARGNELANVPEDAAVPPNQCIKEPTVPDQGDKVPGEYYMTPPRAEILKMSRQQRKAIRDFVVGRENVGRIEWREPVNLDNTDLDEICGNIVQLEIRSASVYNDPLTKAPRGKGLNMPARVYLENSWPRARSGQLPVFERRGKRYEKHVERLRNISGTTFVDFRAEEGIWVFDVEHFSTYSLHYDDTDFEPHREDAPVALTSSILSSIPDSPTPTPAELRGHGRRARASQGLSLGGSNSSHDADDDTFAFHNSRNTSRALPGAYDDEYVPDELLNSVHGSSVNGQNQQPFAQPAPSAPDAEMSGDDLFFRSSTIANDLDGVVDPVAKSTPKHAPSAGRSVKPKSILKTAQPPRTFYESPSTVAQAKSDDWAERLQRTLSPKKQDRNILRQSQGDILREQFGVPPVSNQFTTSLDVMKSLFSNADGPSAKTSAGGKILKMPEPKRVKTTRSSADGDDLIPTWADDLGVKLVDNDDELVQAAQRQLDSLRTTSIYQPFFPAPQELINAQISITKIEQHEGVPFACISEGFSLGVFADAAARQLETLPDGTSPKAFEEEMWLWEMARLLFDRTDSDEDGTVRKGRLMDLWELVVEPDTPALVNAARNPEEKAIALLAGRNAVGASQALIAGRDYRLAVMIAQIGADKNMREDIKAQLQQWRDKHTISEITPRVRTLYEFLAGQTCYSEAGKAAGGENRLDPLNFSQAFGFNWRQSFGLKLWYGTLPEESITDAVLQYLEDLQEEPDQARPLPWFVRERRSTGWSDAQMQQRSDILWSLLKIFAVCRPDREGLIPDDLYNAVWDAFGDMISAENTAGTPYDGRLTFQLYHALAGIGIIDLGQGKARDERRDAITTNFAFQLSSTPEQLANAVFAALHLTRPQKRVAVIRTLLARHAGTIGEGDEDAVYRQLHRTLQIPENWIWFAKATYARDVRQDALEEMRYLLRADEHSAAHDKLRTIVAPRAVIEEDLTTLTRALEHFEACGANQSHEWISGGNIYSIFVAMSAAQADRKVQLAKNLLAAMPAPDADGLVLEERAALWDMRNVADKIVKNAGLEVAGHVDSGMDELCRMREEFYRQVAIV